PKALTTRRILPKRSSPRYWRTTTSRRLTAKRGRFRTYLLAALTHFLADEWDKTQRLKRGGGREIISFDAASAEERYRLEPIDQLNAAKLYERRWVTTLFDKVLARLEQEFRDSGKGGLFDHLKGSLLA